MRRTFKYERYVSKWTDVEIGDVLILEGEDGSIFDIVIMMESSIIHKCDNCPLSRNKKPGECMHYPFACRYDMVAVSIDQVMENL